MSQSGAPSGAAAELLARVRAAAVDTPYTVEPVDDGFEVTVDLPDVRWHSTLQRSGASGVFKHRVKIVDEQSKKFSSTDHQHELTWYARIDTNSPVPRLGASVQRQSGRIYHKSFGTSSMSTAGDVGCSFDSEESRRLITEAGSALGWTTVRGVQEKIAIVAAVIGAGGALVTLIAMGIVFL